MRKSFTQLISTMLLGMLVLLTPYGLWAQPQTTVETSVEDASACYNESNSYQLEISVRDFVKIKELNLELDYEAAVFEYVGFTVNEPKLSGLSVTENTEGTLEFDWTSTTATDVSSSEFVTIVTLEFGLDNFPYNTQFDYTSAFTWDEASSDFLYAQGGTEQIYTGEFDNGNLSVTVLEELRTITVTPDDAICSGDNVNVTVEPDGYEYSFNGTSYTDNNVGNAAEGENTLRVRDANGCISLLQTFTITAPDPVSYNQIVENAVCAGGNGEIQFTNVSGGNGGYTYIVVPISEIDEVGSNAILGDGTLLASYTFNTNQVLRPAGTYMIAVQDQYDCVDLWDDHTGDPEDGWTQVTITEPAAIGASLGTVVDVTCHGSNDGAIPVVMGAGGTPFTEGGDYYAVAINNGTPVEVDAGASYTFTGLTAGSYTITVKDQFCTQTLTATVTEPSDVDITIAYEDVDCVETPDGEISISEIDDVSAGDAAYTGWTFEVVDPDGTVYGPADVGTIIGSLAPNYYSVYVYDANDCEYAYSNPDGSGNRVPVMSPDLIQYDVIADSVCFGEATGTIEVTNYEGAENYEFSIDGVNWQDDNVFTGLAAGSYTVSVRDADNTEACIIDDDVEIVQSDAALDVTVTSTVPPSCDEGTDGNAFAFATGGFPFMDENDDPYYEYALDGSPYWVTNPVFAVTEGDHTIYVRDANGCETSFDFTITDVDPIAIDPTATENPMRCFGDMTTVSIAFTTETTDYADDDYTYYYAMTSDMADMQTFVPEQLAGGDVSATEFGAGTYYFQVESPDGCMSEATELVIEEGEELEIVEWTKENATCASFFDGSITVKVTGGTPFNASVRYRYAVKNNPDVFNNPDAVINWQDFSNDDPNNDSTVTIMTLKGTYFVAVADDCGQIAITDTIIIEGLDAIEIDDEAIETQAVTCFGDADGYIDASGTVTGGSENYFYTLYNSADEVVEGTEENQESGLFENLPAGTYWLEVNDDTDPVSCPAATAMDLVIPEPMELQVDFDSLYVSCAGTEDGEIVIDISGGIGGTYGLNSGATGEPDADLYAEDGQRYRVVINNTDPDGEHYGEYYFGDGVNTKTFQVAAGEYEIYVYDATGECSVGPEVISIEEPEMWDVSVETTQPSDCGLTDGTIEVTVNDGGWEGMTLQYKLNDGSWQTSNTFTTVGFGTHTVSVRNDPDEVSASTDPDINTSACVYEEDVTISEVSPFEYNVEIVDVSCHGGSDGQFIITDVTGGTAGYQFQLVNSENPTVDPTMWLPVDEEGAPDYVTEFTFDTLKYGHHTLYIRDEAGYTLSACQAAESWQIRQPDSLQITQVKWLNDVTCPGGNDGSFEIMVTGGTPEYSYAITESQVVSPNHPYQHMPDPNDETLWQDDPVFQVESGTYIAWVKDANGCWIGGEIRPNGAVVQQHRVIIDEPEDIISTEEEIIDVTCHGLENGEIVINTAGGNGPVYAYEVTGTRYDGDTVSYEFTGFYNGVTDTLALVYASMDDTSTVIGPEDMYAVYAIDQEGCKQKVLDVVVDQPDEFVVDLVIDEDAFVCAGDLSGILDIETVSGGVGSPEYQIYRDDVLVRDWTSNASHVVRAGHEYVVVARDENDCEATDTINIESPLDVTFMVEDRTCYGDDSASVLITVNGTPDREFRVYYTEIENDIEVASNTTDWFESSLLISEEFVFDSDNVDDVHYEIYVEDNFGCTSLVDVVTFDTIQAPLTYDLELIETTECDQTYEITDISGGIDPYVVMVNDSVMTDMTFTLGRGNYTVQVWDTHMCLVEEVIDVEGEYVERTASIETYFERTTEFVDEEAGIDTMLAVGTHEFVYEYADNCERTLIVEVVEISPAEDIMALQGEASTSPWVGYVVEVDGTITGISQNEGFFMQDANAAWSGVWVSYGETAGLSLGDGVLVKGEAAEVSSVTTINAEEVTEADAPVEVEAIVVATPTDAEEEMYESVLVTVEDGTATAANETTGEWTIYYDSFDNIIVNDLLYSFMPEQDYMYTVTGVINGRLDMFKLEPRRRSDIVPANIMTVQGEAEESPWIDADVSLMGTVTGVSVNEGFFMQDANEAWSGIWVVWPDTDELEVGDGVDVTGEVAEVSSVTTINATIVTEVDPILTVEPIVLGSPDEAEQEMYESVLVMVEGAQANAADDVTGEWTIYHEAMEDVTVNDLLFGYTPEEGNFYDVIGIVNGRLDAFKLEPRMEEDIVDLSATPVVDTPANIKFKVYPNPFSERIIIENNDKLTRVVISNIAGQRVMDIEYPNNEIRTANLVSGVYIISLFTEDGIAKSERIVKR